MPKGHFISYIKVKELVLKCCIYHLVPINDSSVKVSYLQSVPIVKEFPEVLSGELPDSS